MKWKKKKKTNACGEVLIRICTAHIYIRKQQPQPHPSHPPTTWIATEKKRIEPTAPRPTNSNTHTYPGEQNIPFFLCGARGVKPYELRFSFCNVCTLCILPHIYRTKCMTASTHIYKRILKNSGAMLCRVYVENMYIFPIFIFFLCRQRVLKKLVYVWNRTLWVRAHWIKCSYVHKTRCNMCV